MFFLFLFLAFANGHERTLINDTSPYQLPSFLIAGTQKSGTTALSAFLAGHSSIVFATRKEVHFFDKTISYNKGIDEYKKFFPQNNVSDINNNTLYGEATPFYLASRLACKRIAKHLPTVKMIVLLRSPVDRAYSEYQMKKRRVAQQSQFFDLMLKHQAPLVDCLLAAQRQNPVNWTNVKDCAPTELGDNPWWPKLKTAITKLVAKMPDQSWTAAIDTCFPLKAVSSAGVVRPKQSLKNEILCTKYTRNILTFNAVNTSNTVANTYWIGSDSAGRFSPLAEVSILTARSDQSWLDGKYPTLNHNKRHGNSSSYLSLAVSATIPHFASQFSVTTSAPQVRGIDFSACWSQYQDGWEDVKSLESAFIGEVEQFRSCGGDLLRDIEVEYQQSGLGGGLHGNGTSDEEFLAHMDSVSSVVDRCLSVRTGISTQYFYRSMFALQLHHCFKSIPSAQFLVIPSGRLRKEPGSVVSSVLQFLSLPQQTLHEAANSSFDSHHGVPLFVSHNDTVLGNNSVSYENANRNMTSAGVIDLSDEGIARAISKHFPVFEKTTGWRLHSEYEPLPSSIRGPLEMFFRPHAHMLLRLLSLHNATILGDIVVDW